MAINGEFGTRLRQARERRGFTQAQLADRAGFKECAISRFETGAANPSLKNFRKLIGALNVTADSLLGIAEVSDRSEWLTRCIRDLREQDFQLAEQLVVRLSRNA